MSGPLRSIQVSAAQKEVDSVTEKLKQFDAEREKLSSQIKALQLKHSKKLATIGSWQKVLDISKDRLARHQDMEEFDVAMADRFPN